MATREARYQAATTLARANQRERSWRRRNRTILTISILAAWALLLWWLF